MYDGGGRSDGPRSEMLITGQKLERTQSGLESWETESNLHTSTNAILAGGKRLDEDDERQNENWTERKTDFYVLGSTKGPEAEPTEVCGPKTKKSTIGKTQIFGGASSGLTKELVRPQQVQPSCTYSETDGVAMEEQALASAALQHISSQKDLCTDELVFSQATWKFGRLYTSYSSLDSPGLAMGSSCPHVVESEDCDDNLRHVVQPFFHLFEN